MSELSIRVTIAGRTYPLTIERDEEEQVRKAAKYIEDKINELRKQYAVTDLQDYLAMVALEMSTEQTKPTIKVDDGFSERITSVNSLLDKYLQ
jgi:cell division protein ZapA (FtsZ GTPase activity inhibitor)